MAAWQNLPRHLQDISTLLLHISDLSSSVFPFVEFIISIHSAIPPERYHTELSNLGNMDNSPLARLPAELRNYIYELVLIETQPIEVNWGYSNLWIAPPLLQTCRQARSEAAPIYYSGSTFTIMHVNTQTKLEAWLRTIGPDARRFLRQVRVGLGWEALGSGRRLERREDYERRLEQCGLGIPEAVLLVSRTQVGTRCGHMR